MCLFKCVVCNMYFKVKVMCLFKCVICNTYAAAAAAVAAPVFCFSLFKILSK